MMLDSMLESKGGETTHQMTDDLSLDTDELEELVYKECNNKPVTSLFLVHVRRILGIFNRIAPENDHILSTTELESLEESVTWFYRRFHHLNDTPDSTYKKFINETTAKSYSEVDESSDIKIFDGEEPIMAISRLQNWFEERRATEPEMLRPTPDEENLLGIRDEYVTGDNVWTLKILSEYLDRDLQRVLRESTGTVVAYESGIRPVLKVSTYLILVGVVLPTMFLFTAPVTLPQWSILVSQVLLLAGTIVLSLTLVEFVLRSTEPTRQMDDKKNMSRLSSTVVNLLPDFPV
jgi:hypothetical protein